MHILLDLIMVLIGLIAGTLGSMVGLGGGFIIVPLATLVLTLPSKLIAGTSTAVIVINSLASNWVYHKQRRIDWKSGIAFAVVAVPGAFLGARFSHDMNTHTFNILFGILLLCVSLLLVFKPREAKRIFFPKTTERRITDAKGGVYSYAFNLPIGLVAAFFVGFLSSLFGIGGGTVMVPMMVLVLGFPAHIATATSMFMILVSSFVGSVSHAMLGDIVWSYALLLSIGALVGGQLGAHWSARVSGVWLLRILAALMSLTAVRMIFA